MTNLSEQFNLLQKAKRLEKIGNSSEALRVYLELHKDHTPNTFDSFERPIILLEKFKRYEEAVTMCEKAITLVNDGKISGTVERFEHRLERIHEKKGSLDQAGSSKSKKTKPKKEKKVKAEKKKKPPKIKKEKKKKKEKVEQKPLSQTPSEQPSNPSPNIDTANVSHREDVQDNDTQSHTQIKGSPFNYENMFKKKGRTFSPLPPGFRSRKKQNMIIASIVYVTGFVLAFPSNYYLFLSIAVAFIAFNYFIDLLGYKINNRHIGYTLIAFLVSLAILSFTGGSVIYNEYNTTPSKGIENSDSSTMGNDPMIEAPRDDNDLPLITESHIQISVEELTNETFVKDANIIVEDETVSFGILVEPGTSTEEAKELGKTLTRTLSSVVASSYSDIDGPNEIGYGEIYDDYSVMITVGTSSDDIILLGQKSKKAIGFKWQIEK